MVKIFENIPDHQECSVLNCFDEYRMLSKRWALVETTKLAKRGWERSTLIGPDELINSFWFMYTSAWFEQAGVETRFKWPMRGYYLYELANQRIEKRSTDGWRGDGRAFSCLAQFVNRGKDGVRVRSILVRNIQNKFPTGKCYINLTSNTMPDSTKS